jgi:hypothetical protein
MRSHRKNPLEIALGIVVLPWRCRVCYNRFFRRRRFQPAIAVSSPAKADASTAKTNEDAKAASTTA